MTERYSCSLTYAQYALAKGPFVAYDDTFLELVGQSPKLSVLHRKDWLFCHEAGVYVRSLDSVFFTANWQARQHSGPTSVFSVHCQTHDLREWTDQLPVEIVNPNGACNLNDNELVFCCQGDDEGGRSALVAWNAVTNKARVLVDHYHGRSFNSINDVLVHPTTGDIWFTDPTYGHDQNFRPPPQLPAQTYRLDVKSSRVYAMDDSLRYPNGLCFSPDGRILYVTDTEAMHGDDRSGGVFSVGDGAKPLQRPGKTMQFHQHGRAHIYSFPLICAGKRLGPRSMLAHVDAGVPDGCKVDIHGNIWTGCGDGLQCHDAHTGELLGKVLVEGGVANFCFAAKKIWIFNERRLIVAEGLLTRGFVETALTAEAAKHHVS